MTSTSNAFTASEVRPPGGPFLWFRLPTGLAPGVLDDGPDRLGELGAGGGAGEGGVAEGEDAAVGGGQQVPLARPGGDHADHRPGQWLVAEGAVEGGVTEGED